MMQSAGMEQFRQRIIASFHLDPLSPEEVQEYIFHRLRLCGWNDNPHFDEGVFGRIFEHTSGVPRRINKLCDRLLLHGSIEELREIGIQDIDVVIDDEKQEMHATAAAREMPPAPDSQPPPTGQGENNVKPLRVENTISNDDRRLLALEKKLENLEETIRRDRKRIQRMIMMLALSEDHDKELLNVLKELDVADR